MNDFHAIIFATLSLVVAVVPVALCFICVEVRASRKVLQARLEKGFLTSRETQVYLENIVQHFVKTNRDSIESTH